MTDKLPMVIGIDPGETTGISVLTFADGRYQLHLATEIGYQQGPVGSIREMIANGWLFDREQLVISVERFVVRGRASRSRSPQAGEHARSIIGAVGQLAEDTGARLVTRTASMAKTWATDRRLDAAGLLAPTRSAGGHRRDACRHALMTGHTVLGWTDPLSKAFTRT